MERAPEVVANGTVADCCMDATKRIRLPGDPTHPERVTEQCVICERRHYKLTVNLRELLAQRQRDHR